MPISTKKPPRTAEEFIGAAGDQEVAGTAREKDISGIVHSKDETPAAPVGGQAQEEEVYVRDKRFLLSIPFELHRLAAEKARERRISLHEFILKAMDRAAKGK